MVEVEADTEFRSRMARVTSISWPLMVGSATSLLVAVADTAILGHYDTGQLAIMARASVVFTLCTAVLVPIGTAVQIVGARWVGAEDHARVHRLLSRGRSFALVIALAAMGVLLFGAPGIISATGGATSADDTAHVLQILALGLPFVAISASTRGWLGAQGLTKIAVIYALVVNLSNVLLDLLLVFRLSLGAVGSAWGSTIAQLLGLITCLIVTARHRTSLPQPADPGQPVLRPLAKVVWPDIVFGLSTYGGDVLIVAVVASLGAVDLAGYRILGSTTAVLFTVAFTCGSGISILVGQRLGADDLSSGLLYARAGAAVMAMSVGIIALPILLVPGLYLRIYTSDPAVVDVTQPALHVYWAISVLIVAAIAMAAVVRGVGDTKSMMYIGLVTQIGIALPATWFLGVMAGLGLPGVALGLLAGWFARTLLTIWRLRITVATLGRAKEQCSRAVVPVPNR